MSLNRAIGACAPHAAGTAAQLWSSVRRQIHSPSFRRLVKWTTRHQWWERRPKHCQSRQAGQPAKLVGKSREMMRGHELLPSNVVQERPSGTPKSRRAM